MGKLTLRPILAFAFILACDVQGTFSQENGKDSAKAEGLFANWNFPNSPGLAVAVLKKGEVVFNKGFGSANLEYNIPITPNTIFHAASLSKQFTGYCLLLLEKEGHLSLNDDIRKYIPEVPDFGKKITLRHLAGHTSGLRDQWRLLYLAGWRMDDVIKKEDIINLVSRQKSLNFDPGEKLMYCNTGFTLLAEVIARVSGKPFSLYTQENIFLPLGMTNTSFHDDYEKIVENRAYSYKNENHIYKKGVLNFATVGATGLFTTVNDMMKWARHLNSPNLQNKDIIDGLNTRNTLNDGTKTEAAMGQWTGVKYKGLEWYDHSGSDASYRAYFSRFPEYNSAVALLANVSSIRASRKALATADLYLKDFYRDGEKVAQSTEIFEHDTKKFIVMTPKKLSKYCGKYWQPEEWYDREIKIINDTLTYCRSEKNQTKLLPVSKNEFKMMGDTNDVSVFFQFKKGGQKSMELIINGESSIQFLGHSQIEIGNYIGKYHSSELGSTISIVESKEELYLKLFKKDSVRLIPITKDVFTSTNWHFKKIEVKRGAKERIEGFYLSNGGVSNLWFKAQ